MVHADTSALASLLTPDLTYTHTDGAQNTRAELLQLLGSGTLRYASIAPEAREVRVVGSSAVVTGRSAMRVEASGQVHAFRIRYLAVYRRGARGRARFPVRSGRAASQQRVSGILQFARLPVRRNLGGGFSWTCADLP